MDALFLGQTGARARQLSDKIVIEITENVATRRVGAHTTRFQREARVDCAVMGQVDRTKL